MKIKKVVAILIVCITLIMQFNFIKFSSVSYASEEIEGNWHYEKLTERAKKIYNAIYTMYSKEMLKSGTQDYDLVSNNCITSNEVEEYVKGNTALMSDFYAARYAFYADYPEIFYVDISKVVMRTTKSNDGTYHAYIGSGNNVDYFIKGFSTENVEKAIKDFDSRVNQIVDGANKLEIAEGMNLQAEKVKYVHNELINSVSYRLLYECTEGNEEFLSTPYGALVKRESVCEGYSRAFKTILDKLGIECILVQGLHRSTSSRLVEHMWNYVKITDGDTEKWYAVDATMDDPYDSENLKTDNGKDGYEHAEYLLAGQTKMYGISEDSGKESYYVVKNVGNAGGYYFDYPDLEEDGFYVKAVINHNGLEVKFFDEGQRDDGVKLGYFYITYKGMGYEKAKEAGYGLIGKTYYYFPTDDSWQEGDWAYFEPNMYPSAITDYDNHLEMKASQCEKIEFAVTQGYNADQFGKYIGTEEEIIARSETFETGAGTYKPAPYIKEITPPVTRAIDPVTNDEKPITYHVRAVYDDRLVLTDEATEPYILCESTGPTGAENTKVENFNYINSEDGNCVVTFDVTFSKYWADDEVEYYFYIKGLVGANSGKVPNNMGWRVRRPLRCAKCMATARDWTVWGTPKLLANSDISTEGWKLENGKSMIGSNINWWDKLTLVTTSTTSDEETAMKNLLENELAGKKYEVSQTYNISLNMCKVNVIQTGSKVRVCLGFPEGYGPESKGVTFKAYHYKTNNNGTITGVEEIDCIVTEYGLLVTCDSFSPFAIVTLEEEEDTSKKVIVSYDDGGVIELDDASKAAGDIITLEKGESKTITVKANNDYEIETITVSGKTINVTNKEEMKVNVSYDDVEKGNNIVASTYVAKAVVEKDQERQEESIPAPTDQPVIEELMDFNAEIKASADTIKKGELFDVTLSIKDMPKGIYAIGGKLEFDKNVLEVVESEIVGIDPWKFTKSDYNLDNFKFVADSGEAVSDASDVLKVTFKVKEDTEAQNTTITIKEVTAGTGEATNGVLNANENSINVQIQEKQEEPYITSDVHNIDAESNIISKVSTKLSIADFKKNFNTNQPLTVIDKEGNSITDETKFISTGMKLKAGETFEFTIVVSGDINGDGVIGIDDIAIIKLHYIEKEKLEGIQLQAADMDFDAKVTINDIAQMKLIYIK